MTFNQAGILCYSKGWPAFVIEIEEKALDLPYFYFRKYIFIFGMLKFDLNFHVTFSALGILGIGSCVSLIVFILEQLVAKYFVKKS